LGSQKAFGPAEAILGQYDPKAYDISFVNNVSLSPSPVTQVKIIDGSQNTFILGQDSRGGTQTPVLNPSGLETFDALQFLTTGSSGTSSRPATYQLSSDEFAEAPGPSVYRTEIVNNGQLYILGAPKNKIYKANFNPANYKNGIPKVGPNGPPDLLFNNVALSVSGQTDPYYVGSTGRIILDPTKEDNSLITDTVGLVQEGLDGPANSTSTQVANFRGGPTLGGGQLCK
jgi:hypothetical protein